MDEDDASELRAASTELVSLERQFVRYLQKTRKLLRARRASASAAGDAVQCESYLAVANEVRHLLTTHKRLLAAVSADDLTNAATGGVGDVFLHFMGDLEASQAAAERIDAALRRIPEADRRALDHLRFIPAQRIAAYVRTLRRVYDLPVDESHRPALLRAVTALMEIPAVRASHAARPTPFPFSVDSPLSSRDVSDADDDNSEEGDAPRDAPPSPSSQSARNKIRAFEERSRSPAASPVVQPRRSPAVARSPLVPQISVDPPEEPPRAADAATVSAGEKGQARDVAKEEAAPDVVPSSQPPSQAQSSSSPSASPQTRRASVQKRVSWGDEARGAPSDSPAELAAATEVAAVTAPQPSGGSNVSAGAPANAESDAITEGEVDDVAPLPQESGRAQESGRRRVEPQTIQRRMAALANAQEAVNAGAQAEASAASRRRYSLDLGGLAAAAAAGGVGLGGLGGRAPDEGGARGDLNQRVIALLQRNAEVEEKLGRAEDRVRQLEAQIASVDREHTGRVEAMGHFHENRLAMVSRDSEARIATVRAECEAQLQQAKRQYEARMATASRDAERRLAAAAEEAQVRLEHAERVFEERVAVLTEDCEARIATVRGEADELVAAAEAQRDSAEERHRALYEEAVERIRAEMEARAAAFKKQQEASLDSALAHARREADETLAKVRAELEAVRTDLRAKNAALEKRAAHAERQLAGAVRRGDELDRALRATEEQVTAGIVEAEDLVARLNALRARWRETDAENRRLRAELQRVSAAQRNGYAIRHIERREYYASAAPRQGVFDEALEVQEERCNHLGRRLAEALSQNEELVAALNAAREEAETAQARAANREVAALKARRRTEALEDSVGRMKGALSLLLQYAQEALVPPDARERFLGWFDTLMEGVGPTEAVMADALQEIAEMRRQAAPAHEESDANYEAGGEYGVNGDEYDDGAGEAEGDYGAEGYPEAEGEHAFEEEQGEGGEEEGAEYGADEAYEDDACAEEPLDGDGEGEGWGGEPTRRH